MATIAARTVGTSLGLILSVPLSCCLIASTFLEARYRPYSGSREPVMLTLAVQGLFQERIKMESPGRMEVRGVLQGKRDLQLFRYILPVAESSDPLLPLSETFLEYQQALDREYPPSDWEGSWYSIRTSESSGRILVLVDTRLSEFPQLDAALLEFDRTKRIAPTSIRNWLEAARTLRQAGKFEEAFRCATAALQRSKLPHIRILSKDDTSLKYRAASSTFDGGHQEQGVDMVVKLAEARLQLLERSWE